MLWWIAGLAVFLTFAGLMGLDHSVARWSAGPQVAEGLLGSGTSLLDWVVLKEISNFLLGAILLVVAAISLSSRRTRPFGWPLLFLASVQFAATVIADLSKPQFGRLRPYEAIADGRSVDTWFVGANAFPSGHAAFYAGLFLPLVLILPRWTLLWLLPPLFIAAARVVEHDHYLSDVTASIALAALLTLAFAFILRKGDRATAERKSA